MNEISSEVALLGAFEALLNQEYGQSQMAAISKGLQSYDPKYFPAVFEVLQYQCKFLPRLADIVEVINSLPQERPEVIALTGPRALSREEEVEQCLRVWEVNFRQNPLYLQAKSEGWDWDLWKYAYGAAYAMAQGICGYQNYRFWYTEHWYWEKYPSTEELARRKADYFRMIEAGVASRRIEIDFPAGVVRYWRAKAIADKENASEVRSSVSLSDGSCLRKVAL